VAIRNATFAGELAVVVFTDGSPNCFPADDGSDGSTGSPTTATGIPTALEPVRATDWLAERNIKTYVVGLPGASGVDLLNEIAVAGGTMQYVLPDDPDDLEALLRTVVSKATPLGFDTCSITLDPPAEAPDKLHVVVNDGDGSPASDRDVPRDLPGSGFTITDDGTQVELLGDLCEDALQGRFFSIRFDYGCTELPPLEPVNAE
jgi:hypothetical protein